MLLLPRTFSYSQPPIVAKPEVLQTQPNCFHSSSRLSLFISLFPHLLIHQTIIISLSLRPIHHLLNHSSSSPLLLFCLHLSLPRYRQHYLPRSVFLLCLLPQRAVISWCFYLFFFLLKPMLLLQCHPVGTLPRWLPLEAEVECMYMCVKRTSFYTVSPASLIGRTGLWTIKKTKKPRE